jgi:polyisoprenoid-binding protein YceI
VQRLRSPYASDHPSRNSNRARFLRPNIVRTFAARYIVTALTSFLLLASAVRAQSTGSSEFKLDPARSTIKFTLDTTLHTVEGTFKFKSGRLSFDPATGQADGQITADATSADTGNKSRDKKMRQEILESQKYPEILFIPEQVKGSVNSQGASQVELTGIFRIHAQDHESTVILTVQHEPNGQVRADAKISVPYIQWGLKNPSSFLLRANDSVEVEIHVTGQLVSAAQH